MERNTLITQERLCQLLDYNPLTGLFTRKGIGKSTVGNVRNHGYLSITLDGVKYYAHRLAWLYVNGCFPTELIDHIDGDRLNNRINNLREATLTQNNQNGRVRKNNKLGVKGVISFRGKFKANINQGSKQFFLGTYDTLQEAHAAYCEAAKVLHGKFFNPGHL